MECYPIKITDENKPIVAVTGQFKGVKEIPTKDQGLMTCKLKRIAENIANGS